VSTTDYIVKDISLADYGRKEINMAQDEMPGLMAIREEHKGKARSRAPASPAACT
jgi:adenosylhomocysteinase